MKKWIPFTVLLVIAILIIFYLIGDGESDYTPKSSDPALVYSEACNGCHGPEDRSGPDLAEKTLTEFKVKNIVRNGSGRMPAFPLIPDSTLDSLAIYVAGKRFIDATL